MVREIQTPNWHESNDGFFGTYPFLGSAVGFLGKTQEESRPVFGRSNHQLSCYQHHRSRLPQDDVFFIFQFLTLMGGS